MLQQLPEGVRLDKGLGGQDCLFIDTPLCQAQIYLLGACVTDFQPRGGEPVPRALEARQLVFALPTFLRHHLIAELRGAPPPPHLQRFSYAPWLVANLTLRRSPPAPSPVRRSRTQGDDGLGAPGFPLCWDNVLVESPSLGYVVATHQREPALPRDGVPRSVWTYYLPLCGPDPRAERTRLFQTPWPVWRDAIASDLLRAEPELPAQLLRTDVFRWGHGMIRPVPGLLCGLIAGAERRLISSSQ